jgi:hypothetical protein
VSTPVDQTLSGSTIAAPAQEGVPAASGWPRRVFGGVIAIGLYALAMALLGYPLLPGSGFSSQHIDDPLRLPALVVAAWVGLRWTWPRVYEFINRAGGILVRSTLAWATGAKQQAERAEYARQVALQQAAEVERQRQAWFDQKFLAEREEERRREDFERRHPKG